MTSKSFTHRGDGFAGSSFSRDGFAGSSCSNTSVGLGALASDDGRGDCTSSSLVKVGRGAFAVGFCVIEGGGTTTSNDGAVSSVFCAKRLLQNMDAFGQQLPINKYKCARFMFNESMQALRLKYPCHIPCRISVPENKTLKLLMPHDATVAAAMLAVRKKWPLEKLTEADALFCFHKNAICIGNTRLSSYDTHKPHEIQFTVRQENTFG